VVAITAARRGFGGVALARIAGRRQQARGCAVHAQAAVGGKIDQILRVNRAIQMVVQVSTFRQVVYEGQQQLRLLANPLQRQRRSLFSALGHSQRGHQQDR